MRNPSRPYGRLKSLAAKSGTTLTEACKELNIPVGTIHNWGGRPPRSVVQYLKLIRYFRARLRAKAESTTTDLSEAVRRVVERFNFKSTDGTTIPRKFFEVLNPSELLINSANNTEQAAPQIAQHWGKELRRFFKGDFTITVRTANSLAGQTFYFYEA